MVHLNLLHHGIFHGPEIVHGESHRHEKEHQKPGAELSMKAQKNAQAADDGHDTRSRHQNAGDGNALRGRVRDLWMGKMAEPGYNENQRIEQTPQNNKIAHGLTTPLQNLRWAQAKLRGVSQSVRPQRHPRSFALRPLLPPAPIRICFDFPRV